MNKLWENFQEKMKNRGKEGELIISISSLIPYIDTHFQKQLENSSKVSEKSLERKIGMSMIEKEEVVTKDLKLLLNEDYLSHKELPNMNKNSNHDLSKSLYKSCEEFENSEKSKEEVPSKMILIENHF